VFILFLVAMSIMWIPIIQELQGGQLFIYIQAISAYLSPPIAIVYCMAISWGRMNEKGAFWGLMFGLTVGVIRMVLDFTYKAPLCMEIDDRPFIIASIHYMYFAAGLFFTTGVVVVIVSLLTQPPRDYMLVRTTFQTRKDQRVRKDEYENLPGAELDPLHENGRAVAVEVSVPDTPGCCTRMANCVLGWEGDSVVEEKNHQEMAEHVQNLSTLAQTTGQKVILYTNLLIIISLAIFLYIFFSINPFSVEELDHFREVSLNKTITTAYFTRSEL